MPYLHSFWGRGGGYWLGYHCSYWDSMSLHFRLSSVILSSETCLIDFHEAIIGSVFVLPPTQQAQPPAFHTRRTSSKSTSGTSGIIRLRRCPSRPATLGIDFHAPYSLSAASERVRRYPRFSSSLIKPDVINNALRLAVQFCGFGDGTLDCAKTGTRNKKSYIRRAPRPNGCFTVYGVSDVLNLVQWKLVTVGHIVCFPFLQQTFPIRLVVSVETSFDHD